MVGKSAQMVEGENRLPPMYKLHKRLFPVLLRLACDVDQVCALQQDRHLKQNSHKNILGYHGIWRDCIPDRERSMVIISLKKSEIIWEFYRYLMGVYECSYHLV